MLNFIARRELLVSSVVAAERRARCLAVWLEREEHRHCVATAGKGNILAPSEATMTSYPPSSSLTLTLGTGFGFNFCFKSLPRCVAFNTVLNISLGKISPGEFHSIICCKMAGSDNSSAFQRPASTRRSISIASIVPGIDQRAGRPPSEQRVWPRA